MSDVVAMQAVVFFDVQGRINVVSAYKAGEDRYREIQIQEPESAANDGDATNE